MSKTVIDAEVVAHSISARNEEIVSLVITFPRYILSEINTHRMLTRSTSSSRAIPFTKMVEVVENDPFIPKAYQKSHKGMQGTKYFTSKNDIEALDRKWLEARDMAVQKAKELHNMGVTKQMVNRLIEPYMWTKMLITGSSEAWDNFFNLRSPRYRVEIDGEEYEFYARSFITGLFPNVGFESFTDLEWRLINGGQADIHMMDLAEVIWDRINDSEPKLLKAGEFHIPFVDKMDWGKITQLSIEHETTPVQIAIKISTAMAARVSYTAVGGEKEIDYDNLLSLHSRLMEAEPKHSSPLEHTAECVNNIDWNESFKGNEAGWFRMYKGFKSYRQIAEEFVEAEEQEEKEREGDEY